MAWGGSLSSSLLYTARYAAFGSSMPRSAPRRLRPPSATSSGVNLLRVSFSNPRTLGVLGCAQSLMLLHSVAPGIRLTSHLAVNVRAFCELSNGTFAVLKSWNGI